MISYLEMLPNADQDSVRSLHQEKQAWINQPKKGFLRYREPLQTVQYLRASKLDFAGDVVRIGQKSDLTSSEHEQVLQLMQLLFLEPRLVRCRQTLQ